MSEISFSSTPLLVPYICVDNGLEAIKFYERAFGAKQLDLSMAQDGKRVMHASLSIQGQIFMLSDDFAEMRDGKSRTPKALGGTPVTLHLNVSNVDELWQQAVAAGAKIVMPLADQFWGDRYGVLEDPFGHSWALDRPGVRKA